MHKNPPAKYVYQKKIQKKREEMIALGKKYGLNHQTTIMCSQQLDQLMNEYERLFPQTIVKRDDAIQTFRRKIPFIVLLMEIDDDILSIAK